LRKAGALRYQL